MCECVRARARVCVCVCVCVYVCVCVCVCHARPKPRGLTGIDSHRRTPSYLKTVIGKIHAYYFVLVLVTHALQLHTLRMQTLEMVKKHKHLNNNNNNNNNNRRGGGGRSASGIILFRGEQGLWKERGLKTKRSHEAII